MDAVNQISQVLIDIIRVGAVFRLVYCLFRMISAEDEQAMYKKRARNVVIFYIIAETIFQLKDILIGYYQ